MDNSSIFATKAEEAPNIIKAMRDKVENTEKRLHALVNNKDRSSLTKSMLGSVGWLLFFVITGLLTLLSGYRGIIILINIVAIISGGWVALILFFNNVNVAKHYWSYMDYTEELSDLKANLDKGLFAINVLQQNYDNAQDNGWDYKLNVAESIDSTLDEIEKKVKGIPGFDSSLLYNNNSLLYYVAAVTGTFAFGYQLLERVFIPLSGGLGFSEHTTRVIAIIALIISSFGELFLARIALTRTEGEVTNLTLFVIPLSAICTLIVELIVVIALAAGLAILRWVFVAVGIIILIVIVLAFLGLL